MPVTGIYQSVYVHVTPIHMYTHAYVLLQQMLSLLGLYCISRRLLWFTLINSYGTTLIHVCRLSHLYYCTSGERKVLSLSLSLPLPPSLHISIPSPAQYHVHMFTSVYMTLCILVCS